MYQITNVKGVSMARMAVECLSRYVSCGPERIRSRSCLVPRWINPPVIDEYLRRMVITCETSCSAFSAGHLNYTSLYDKELFLNKCTCTLKIYNVSFSFYVARQNRECKWNVSHYWWKQLNNILLKRMHHIKHY